MFSVLFVRTKKKEIAKKKLSYQSGSALAIFVVSCLTDYSLLVTKMSLLITCDVFRAYKKTIGAKRVKGTLMQI